ncbi:MAG: putative baseplate assembly protein [Desulfobacterales bacterium]|nr:putative baseplate assembly protein [Desulfobacterales bacterium]
MAVRPPVLDDRSFDDLVEEVLARIPAHTPEWTNPRPGDPGRTLVELFAWLTDTLLYRANLIPERQRLAFLRLLGVRMRPAVAARTILGVYNDDKKDMGAHAIQPLAAVKGPVDFETRSELTVLPVTAEVYCKRALCEVEKKEMADLVLELKALHGLKEEAEPYITTPVFPGGAPVNEGFDMIAKTVDERLWLALLAPTPEGVEAATQTLGDDGKGGRRLINIGVMPTIETPALFEEIGPRAATPHVWEISFVNQQGKTAYHELDRIEDGSAGLTRRGVQRLALPAVDFIGAPTNDVRSAPDAGVGDAPPRLDDPEKAARLVAWIRLGPPKGAAPQRMSLSWVGLNAVEVDQRRTLFGRIAGVSDGSADQEFQLPGVSVEEETLEIQVEAPGRGYAPWRRVDDLALAGRNDPVYRLDAEAGLIRFGDGVRGVVPAPDARVRVARMRAGGGGAGNLPPGSLGEIKAKDLHGNPVSRLKAFQPLPADGGEDAETLAEAERRIPALFRHGDRAVTGEDYARLAADAPGVRVGRVEVMPGFKPHQRLADAPGVVSVMTLPYKEAARAPNPRPDRPFLETMHAWLDRRRVLGVELYVIGCKYVPVGLSVGINIRDGFGHDEVVNNVRDALHTFLWTLPPGGIEAGGWPLGAPVWDRELEVVAARVPGVIRVNGIHLFEKRGKGWRRLTGANRDDAVVMPLEPWEAPELLKVEVVGVVGPGEADPPEDLADGSDAGADPDAVAIPVALEVCR